MVTERSKWFFGDLIFIWTDVISAEDSIQIVSQFT